MWKRRRRREIDLIDKIQGKSRRVDNDIEDCIPFPDDLNYSFYTGMLETAGKRSQNHTGHEGTNTKYHMIRKKGETSEIPNENKMRVPRKPQNFNVEPLGRRSPSFTQKVDGQNYRQPTFSSHYTASRPYAELASTIQGPPKPTATVSPSPKVSTGGDKSIGGNSLQAADYGRENEIKQSENRNSDQQVPEECSVTLRIIDKQTPKVPENVPTAPEIVLTVSKECGSKSDIKTCAFEREQEKPKESKSPSLQVVAVDDRSPVEDNLLGSGSFRSSVCSEPPFPLTQKHNDNVSDATAWTGEQTTELHWSPADLLLDKQELLKF